MSDLHLTGVRYELTRTLIHDLDLTFRAGRLTALSGPSGSGKTTRLKLFTYGKESTSSMTKTSNAW